MKNNTLILSISILCIFASTSCKKIPKNATAVTNFDITQYVGKWYEIARLDFKFEKDLNNTTAEYTLNEDGTVKVLNKGYNTKKQEWQEAEGKAKFVGDNNVAELKVSFFGPFYSGYNVIALDPQYQYALVIGESKKYMWILSRTKSIPETIKNDYLNIASELGYKTEDLVWVEHN